MIPLQSAFAVAFRCRQENHEVAGCFPVFLVLERHIEVWGGPEHVEERPQCKAPDAFLLDGRKRQIRAPIRTCVQLGRTPPVNGPDVHLAKSNGLP